MGLDADDASFVIVLTPAGHSDAMSASALPIAAAVKQLLDPLEALRPCLRLRCECPIGSLNHLTVMADGPLPDPVSSWVGSYLKSVGGRVGLRVGHLSPRS